jgi:hypothetical protein
MEKIKKITRLKPEETKVNRTKVNRTKVAEPVSEEQVETKKKGWLSRNWKKLVGGVAVLGAGIGAVIVKSKMSDGFEPDPELDFIRSAQTGERKLESFESLTRITTSDGREVDAIRMDLSPDETAFWIRRGDLDDSEDS